MRAKGILLSKRNLISFMYLLPEILIVIGILRRFLKFNDLWVLSAIFIYEYALVYFKVGFKKIIDIILKLLPFLIICFFYFTNLSATVTLIFTPLIYTRGFIYKNQRIDEYSIFMFFLEAFIFALIALFINIGYIIIYAVILKLICLILVNITVNVDNNMDDTDKMIILLNFAVLALYPFGKLLLMIWYKLFKDIEHILNHVFYGIGMVLDFLLNNMPHRLLMAIENAFHLIFNILYLIFSFLYRLNKYINSINKAHNGFIWGKIFISLFYLLSLMAIIWGIIFLITGVETDETKEAEDYTEEILKIKTDRQKTGKNISEIRKLYRKILMLAVNNGYKLKNSSTARSVGIFLKENVTNDERINEINDIYENERYADRSKSTVEQFKELCDKIIRYSNVKK